MEVSRQKETKNRQCCGVQLYEYQPLERTSQPGGQFRLLTLFPGQKGSRIRCSLQTASLASPPQHEALSSTWGNPKGPASTVFVKGNPNGVHTIKFDGSYATITSNLKAALQHLRYRSEPRALWMDALCIN
ncbi:MAG: hypothetical protein ALECFALPRED_006521 [Alectoria fallacina]|uniref:Heterokaryon incompatibility domain-containing protein n=1 Tax=Alectoria fallacina TaxID=1903189 RepID=A0A8H3G9Y8_9LECA|nr:MAG: hypothetical protein ALECFALPRED_006521 [Alectoria fallacina]